MSARPIIIDCDPGQDDAVALLLAMASPAELDIRGVCAVAGNVPLARTEDNARRIRDLAGRGEIPVHAGCARPLLRTLETAEFIHGPSGIDGAELAPPKAPLAPGHAVDFIVDTLKDATTPVTLATLGPLTNVGLALAKEPGIVESIGEIVTMGGAVSLGNVTPAAEFNIFVDPHAAHIVFEAGVPLTMIGLDVTHQALATPARVDAIRALDGAAATSVVGMLDYYAAQNRAAYDHGGAPLHDPCVIAYLLQPSLFEGRAMRVDVELTDGHSLGRTVCDVHGRTGRPANVNVIETIDDDGFFSLLTERLARLG